MPKLASYPTVSVEGAAVFAASGAVIVQGMFVGLDSSGLVRPADYRSLQGPIIAFGVATHDGAMKDPRGNTLGTQPMIGWTKEGKLSGYTNLTPGKAYYALSGGGITGASPALTASGNTEQVLGFALSATELQIMIGSPLVR